MIVRYPPALPWPCAPLLDDLPAEIGINLSFFSARNRVYQSGVADLLFPGEPLKPSRLENSRATRSLFHTPLFYRTRYYVSRLHGSFYFAQFFARTPHPLKIGRNQSQ